MVNSPQHGEPIINQPAIKLSRGNCSCVTLINYIPVAKKPRPGFKNLKPVCRVGVLPLQTVAASNENYDAPVGCASDNMFRIYDPYLGRFLSADPVLPDAGNMQSYNRYSYVRNNPLKLVDPTGNFEIEFKYSGTGGIFGDRNPGGFFDIDRIEQSVIRTGIEAGLSNAEIDANFIATLQGIRANAVSQSDTPEDSNNDETGVQIGLIPGESGSGPPTLLFAFDGAGGEGLLGNSDFSDLVDSIGLPTKRFDSKPGDIFGRVVRRAVRDARAFLKKNPDGIILAIGYSAGGADAVRFTNRLAKENIIVAGLVTIDPRSGTRLPGLGGNTIKVSPLTTSINFYQTKPTPFSGSRVEGGLLNVNVNLTTDATHNTIPGVVADRFGSSISAFFRVVAARDAAFGGSIGR